MFDANWIFKKHRKYFVVCGWGEWLRIMSKISVTYRIDALPIRSVLRVLSMSLAHQVLHHLWDDWNMFEEIKSYSRVKEHSLINNWHTVYQHVFDNFVLANDNKILLLEFWRYCVESSFDRTYQLRRISAPIKSCIWILFL